MTPEDAKGRHKEPTNTRTQGLKNAGNADCGDDTDLGLFCAENWLWNPLKNLADKELCAYWVRLGFFETADSTDLRGLRFKESM
jgi:hypothetical protein